LTNEPLHYKNKRKMNHRATFRKNKHSVQLLFYWYIVYIYKKKLKDKPI